ncbi:MAG: NAD(P)-dependent oxidoreductase [Bacteroidetes bacterium]|nr:NAD(P)-dependent oxidoreductase [Bacteroidota bacterium]
MKYLITGASGFIGSFLTRYLLDRNHQVIALGRSFSNEMKEILYGADFVEADVLSSELSDHRINADVVVHLAAANDKVSKDLSKGIELSAVGTVNTMNLAIANGIEKFIFYSTLQVYGGELVGNYSEGSQALPVNDYGMNHLFGEMYCEMYSRMKGLKTLVVRPSNIYGPFLSKEVNRWTLVPGCFCKEAVEKKTITLLSSGKQMRNFITLEQLSYGTQMAAENIHKPFDVLNFVSHDYRCIHDVAVTTHKVLKNEFNMNVALNIASNQPTESNHFQFSHDKLLEYGIDMNDVEVSMEGEINSVIRTLLG